MIHVGQTLYKASGKKGEAIEEFVVTKIGRKNFETDSPFYRRGKFVIETLRYEDPDYTQNSFQLYTSPEEIEREKRASELQDKIKKYFQGYHRLDLTVDQCEKIIEILGI